jgi:hypothetical protein
LYFGFGRIGYSLLICFVDTSWVGAGSCRVAENPLVTAVTLTPDPPPIRLSPASRGEEPPAKEKARERGVSRARKTENRKPKTQHRKPKTQNPTPKGENTMLDDTVIIALVPGCVEVAKRSGLPTRVAPLAAIVIAVTLVMLSGLAGGTGPMTLAVVARLLLTGLIDGLAAIGLYRLVPKTVSTPAPS